MKNTKFTFTKYLFFEEIKIPQTSQKNDVFWLVFVMKMKPILKLAFLKLPLETTNSNAIII